MLCERLRKNDLPYRNGRTGNNLPQLRIKRTIQAAVYALREGDVKNPEKLLSETMNKVSAMKSQKDMTDSLSMLVSMSAALLREMHGDKFVEDFLAAAIEDKSLLRDISKVVPMR